MGREISKEVLLRRVCEDRQMLKKINLTRFQNWLRHWTRREYILMNNMEGIVSRKKTNWTKKIPPVSGYYYDRKDL